MNLRHTVLIAFSLIIGLVMATRFVKAESPTIKNEHSATVPTKLSPLNVLLICVDDLRPELACYGKDYIQSPHIDRLAKTGRLFKRHYVQAPTCGASRYTLLTGRYGGAEGGRDNGALFKRAQQLKSDPDSVPPTMPAWFRQHGYTTVSVGKVSHHPGGRGGKDWDDDSVPELPNSWDRHLLPAGPWQHPRGAMHGLANGEIRGDASKMALFESVEGPDSIYPDGLIIDTSIEQLNELSKSSDAKPFFLAVGIIRPHLPLGAPAKYFPPYENAELPPTPHPEKPIGKTTWHGSGEFMKYDRRGRNPSTDAEFAMQVRRHYAACVSYADAQVGRILQRLDELRLRENTIVVLWGDHGWHLGEHGIWGKHALFEESLHSPLIISYPAMANPGPTNAIVETIDLFPTLTEVAGVQQPEFAQGVSLRPILDDPDVAGHDAFSYFRNRETIRTEKFRMIVHKDGFAELYDHESSDEETLNVAKQHPDVVVALKQKISDRLHHDADHSAGK